MAVLYRFVLTDCLTNSQETCLRYDLCYCRGYCNIVIVQRIVIILTEIILLLLKACHQNDTEAQNDLPIELLVLMSNLSMQNAVAVTSQCLPCSNIVIDIAIELFLLGLLLLSEQ